MVADSTPMGQRGDPEETIDELVEREAAVRGIPPGTLWQLTLQAIEEGALQPCYRAELPPGAVTWKSLIVGARHAANRGNHVSGFHWLKAVTLDSAKFSAWLDDAYQYPSSAARRRAPRARAAPGRVGQVIRAYLDDERDNGRQSNQKRMWAWVKAELPNATNRQALDVMRTLEGEPKPRGRPRKPAEKST